MGDYHIYLSFNNLQEVIELPVLPEKITFQQSGGNQTYDILNTGQINVIKGLGLPELDLEGYFPTDDIHVTAGTVYTPMYYVEKLQKWAATLRPIRLTMTGTIELSWAVSIEDFEYTEEGGAVGEIQYKLSLKKYLFYGPAAVTIIGDTATTASTRASDKVTPTTITVRQNEDTFWLLAKKYLGDGSKASRLAALNGLTVGTVLFVGQVVRLS